MEAMIWGLANLIVTATWGWFILAEIRKAK